MGYPLVSIIIPTYNRSQYLGETLDTVLSQSYRNWECLVIDDSSKDYTLELMEFYCKKDSRIKYFKKQEEYKKGANSCRNYGFTKSKGKYLQWLDSDDLIASNKLEKQVAILEKNNGELVSCKWGKIIENEEPFLLENLESYNHFGSLAAFLTALGNSEGYFPIHSYLMSKDLAFRSGLWNGDLQVNQDGEFMTRVFLKMNTIFFSPDTYVMYRKNVQASTSQRTLEDFASLIKSWELIEKHLNNQFSGQEFDYLQDAKRRIFIKYRDNSKLIDAHRNFFGSIPEEEPSDFRLSFYRIVVKYWLTRNILRFLKNLKRGRISVEKV